MSRLPQPFRQQKFIILTRSVNYFERVDYHVEVVQSSFVFSWVLLHQPSHQFSKITAFDYREVDISLHPVFAYYACFSRSTNRCVPTLIRKHPHINPSVLTLSNDGFHALPDDILDADNGNKYEIFFDLTPLIGDAIDLLVGDGQGPQIILAELVDSLMDAAPSRGRNHLDLLMFVDIVRAVGQQEVGGPFHEQVQFATLVAVHCCHLPSELTRRVDAFDS